MHRQTETQFIYSLSLSSLDRSSCRVIVRRNRVAAGVQERAEERPFPAARAAVTESSAGVGTGRGGCWDCWAERRCTGRVQETWLRQLNAVSVQNRHRATTAGEGWRGRRHAVLVISRWMCDDDDVMARLLNVTSRLRTASTYPALQRAQNVTPHLYNTDYYIIKLNRSTSSVYSSTL